MHAGNDERRELTPAVEDVSAPATGHLQDILSTHQHWVQTGGKEGKRADLAEASLGRASLRLVVLSEANLQGADLDRAILTNARLQGADLQRASLRGADLQLAVLQRANLQGADLFEANLEGASLPETMLQGSNLYAAVLQGANLQRASLQRALVKEANLQGANLQGANLQGANLQGADLRGTDLRRTTLREANLAEANLQGADLQGADLQGCNVQDASLQHANLRHTDLTGTVGLVGPQLAGTILAGARLPAVLSPFAALGNVKALAKHSRKLLLLLLLGYAFSWLVIVSTTDIMLLTNSPAALLPHFTMPIPSATWYLVMPLVLLALFVYFHLHLYRLWEELAELPAVFPDGRPLDKTAYPWLVLGLVRSHVWRLRLHRPPLSRLQSSLALLLAWWLLPGTLTVFWLRYLPTQDWRGTTWHITLLVASIGLTVLFQGLTRTRLRGRVIRRFQHGAVALLLAFASSVLASVISFGALMGLPPHVAAASPGQELSGAALTSRSLRQLVPRLLAFIHVSPFADLVQAQASGPFVALQQDGGEGLEYIKGVVLRHRSLRYASAAGAFLARADLQGADLSGADLRLADLRGAHFEGAELFLTNLQGANLSFATGLTREQLASARLDTTTRLPDQFSVLVPSAPAGR